jgi:PhnB protein
VQGFHTYLVFDGNCRQAMEFYANCLGAELNVMRFGDAPMKVSPEVADRVIHARLAKGPAAIMASDTQPGMTFHQGNNFSIALGCDSGEEVDRLFAALSAGGKVMMPPQETFWAARFAGFTDKFGVGWMLNFEKQRH